MPFRKICSGDGRERERMGKRERPEDAEWVANGDGQRFGGKREPKPLRGPRAGGDERFGQRNSGTH